VDGCPEPEFNEWRIISEIWERQPFAEHGNGARAQDVVLQRVFLSREAHFRASSSRDRTSPLIQRIPEET